MIAPHIPSSRRDMILFTLNLQIVLGISIHFFMINTSYTCCSSRKEGKQIMVAALNPEGLQAETDAWSAHKYDERSR